MDERRYKQVRFPKHDLRTVLNWHREPDGALQLLTQPSELPPDVKIRQVYVDHECDCIVAIVYHPSFRVVADGERIPYADPARLRLRPKAKCKWKKEADHPGNIWWNTGCGDTFQTNVLIEYIKFCPYCGLEVEEVKPGEQNHLVCRGCVGDHETLTLGQFSQHRFCELCNEFRPIADLTWVTHEVFTGILAVRKAEQAYSELPDDE